MPDSPGWKSIEDLADAVRTCTRCRLHSGRTNAVPGDGSPVASILIIGEGPGFNEDEQGLPFVGRSGKLLDELLAAVPLARKDVFITNVVKCRPPENRDPQPDEVAACRPYLERQMELLDPKVIVTLGRHSLQRFYPEGRISKDHGKILWWNDRILFPLFHPAAGLRNPAVKRNLQEDVLRLPDALRESLRRPSGRISSETSAEALGPPQPGPAAPGPVDTPAWRAEGARAGADRGGPEPDTQLSEPQIENETSEEEQGDRQLGLL